MNDLETNVLLMCLSSRVIRQRKAIRESREKATETQNGYTCTGQWIGNVFRIEISKES